MKRKTASKGKDAMPMKNQMSKNFAAEMNKSGFIGGKAKKSMMMQKKGKKGC